jgi:hypothetical protein
LAENHGAIRVKGVSARQLAGWALIAAAGVVSSGIVAIEVTQLVAEVNRETPDIPIVGFEPVAD